MSRIIGVTLLLLILIDCVCNSKASSTEFHVAKKHIRKCRCRVSPNGLIKCLSPLLPTKHKERRDLIKCLCSKTDKRKFQVSICTSRGPGFPITLV